MEAEPTFWQLVFSVMVLVLIYLIMLLFFRYEELKQKDDYRRTENGKE